MKENICYLIFVFLSVLKNNDFWAGLKLANLQSEVQSAIQCAIAVVTMCTQRKCVFRNYSSIGFVFLLSVLMEMKIAV